MKKYEYRNDGGLKYPVDYGDLWKCDNSLIGCYDIDNGEAIKFFSNNGGADIAYIDPPWNQGNANTFRGKAGLTQNVNFQNLLENIMDILKLVRRDVFIEMGIKSEATLHRIIEQNGGSVINRFDTKYYRTKNSTLTHCAFNEKYADIPDFTGIWDRKIPPIAIEATSKQGETVLDCCLGLGLTLRSAVILKRKFIGTELSPNRVSASLDSIFKINGIQPIKIK